MQKHFSFMCLCFFFFLYLTFARLIEFKIILTTLENLLERTLSHSVSGHMSEAAFLFLEQKTSQQFPLQKEKKNGNTIDLKEKKLRIRGTWKLPFFQSSQSKKKYNLLSPVFKIFENVFSSGQYY